MDMDIQPQSPTRKKSKLPLLLCIVVITLMVCLDTSIVNVAMPVMADELGVTMAQIEWIATSYLLMVCSTLLFFGRLGDILGKAAVFQAGVATFTIGSLICGIAPNLVMIIIGRIVQGAGAGASFSNNQALIFENFDTDEHGSAMGLLSTAAAIGSLLGPPLGGALVTFGHWGYIFLINVPIGIAAFVAGHKLLPNIRPEKSMTLDVLGSILLFVSLAMTIASVTLMQQQTTNRELVMLVVGLILLLVFFFFERHAACPIFPVQAVRNPSLIINLGTLFVIFFIMAAQNLILPFYFQRARELTPMRSAMYLSIIPVVLGIGGPIGGRWSDRIGRHIPTIIGLGLVLAAMLTISSLSLTAPLVIAAIGLILYGMGEALFIPPNNSLIMESSRPEELGFVGGLSGFCRMFGQTLGITVATSALYGHMSDEAGMLVSDFVDGHPEIFMHAMSFVFFILAIVVLLGFIATIYRYAKFLHDQKLN